MDKKKVVVLNLESVSTRSHLGMCCFLDQVFGSVSQSLLFLCGCLYMLQMCAQVFAKFGVAVCCGVC